MGEIADDMIEGYACSFCGIYFIEPHGYPVICIHCAEKETTHSMQGTGLQIAHIEELC